MQFCGHPRTEGNGERDQKLTNPPSHKAPVGGSPVSQSHQEGGLDLKDHKVAWGSHVQHTDLSPAFPHRQLWQLLSGTNGMGGPTVTLAQPQASVRSSRIALLFPLRKWTVHQ